MKSYFHLSPHQLSWPLLILLILILLVIVLAWPDPASGQASVPTATLVPLTPTAIPGFYNESADQTAGIIFGAVVLVLIILGGTIGVMRWRNGNARH